MSFHHPNNSRQDWDMIGLLLLIDLYLIWEFISTGGLS